MSGEFGDKEKSEPRPSEERLRNLREELFVLKDSVASGLFEAINRENFPFLSSNYSDFLNTQRLASFNNRVQTELANLKVFPGNHEETMRRLREFYQRITEFDQTEVSKGKLPEPRLSITTQDLELLESLVKSGIYEKINPSRFPGFPERYLNQVKALALSKRIEMIDQILTSQREGTTGFREGRPDPVIKHLEEEKKSLKDMQRELLKPPSENP